MQGTVTNSLVDLEEEKQSVNFEVDGQEVRLNPAMVAKYLVSGTGKVTEQEMRYFLVLCKARKLNPFTKDVYLMKFGDNPAQMVVSKDVLERRAIKNPLYRGKKVGIFVTNKEGELLKREHTILLKDETLVGAWCEVYREGWNHPAKVEVNYDEYVGRKKDGEINSQWSSKPVTMLVKVAKAQALREAFIEELQGMYEAEELEKDNPGIKEAMDKPPIPEELKDILNETTKSLEDKKNKQIEEIEEVSIL
ncbi:MAG: phage recombination protein Bet [Cetobacterium sp.]|uniref:phage recombination protein Bet n=1 Tax=Cetobacterium sp. TaxID=2071632 RepID=UPI003EE5D5CA